MLPPRGLKAWMRAANLSYLCGVNVAEAWAKADLWAATSNEAFLFDPEGNNIEAIR